MSRCPASAFGERKLTVEESIEAALAPDGVWPRRMPIVLYCAKTRGHRSLHSFRSRRYLAVRRAVRIAFAVAVLVAPFGWWALVSNLV